MLRFGGAGGFLLESDSDSGPIRRAGRLRYRANIRADWQVRNPKTQNRGQIPRLGEGGLSLGQGLRVLAQSAGSKPMSGREMPGEGESA